MQKLVVFHFYHQLNSTVQVVCLHVLRLEPSKNICVYRQSSGCPQLRSVMGSHGTSRISLSLCGSKPVGGFGVSVW